MKQILILLWSVVAFVLLSVSTGSASQASDCLNKPRSCTNNRLLCAWAKDGQGWAFDRYSGKSNAVIKEAGRRGLSCGLKKRNPYDTVHNSLIANIFKKHSLADRKRIQTALKTEGYYELSIDGIWGKGTSAAIKAYGKSRDLLNKDEVAVLYIKLLYVFNTTKAEDLSRFADWKICEFATEGGKWRKDQESFLYRSEVKKRNLTCDVREPLVLVQKISPTKKEKTCVDDPTLCTIAKLCGNATILKNGKRAWTSSSSKKSHVEEAKKNGLRCGIEIKPEKPNAVETYKVASGTGFYISALGHLVTNHHVIEGCKKVKAHRKGVTQEATIIAVDRLNDLALLQVKTPSSYVFPISAANCSHCALDGSA